jgi:Holliday junction resolvasome RuvABC endonuclease subunit
MIHIGIDPGGSGAIAALGESFSGPRTCKLDGTERDIADFLECIASYDNEHHTAVIERVHSMPKQGVSSSFKFGQSYGFLRGLLIALRIPFEEVTPQKWQQVMGCRSGGDKNVTKAKAQQLFPSVKVTHAIADALLLAEYLRRTHVNHSPSPIAAGSGREGVNGNINLNGGK